MAQGKEERQQWIDVLRGIGILLVVWGHVYGGYSFEVIFLFHMPLFFFISGYLFQPVQPVTGFAMFWRRKALQLLLPYTMFLLAIGVPLGLATFWGQPHDPAAWAAFVLDLILGGSRLSAWLAAFWFVTSFFAVLLIEAWLVGRCSRRALLWLHGGMLLMSYLIAWRWPGLQVPWALDVALAAAPFFHAGYLYGRVPDTRRLDAWALSLALLAVIVVLANHHFGWRLDLGYDMKVSHYGMPGMSFVAALACCVAVTCLARRTTQAGAQPYLVRGLAQLGQAALVVMFMHMIFTMGLAKLVGEQYRLARVCAGLLGSYLVYRACQQRGWSRALLLGSAPDLADLRRRWRLHNG